MFLYFSEIDRNEKPKKEKAKKKQQKQEKMCGLCGSTSNVIKTDCCNNWICDSNGPVPNGSYGCYESHTRFTLCEHHFDEKHSGKWQNCTKCKNDFSPQIYDEYVSGPGNFKN